MIFFGLRGCLIFFWPKRLHDFLLPEWLREFFGPERFHDFFLADRLHDFFWAERLRGFFWTNRLHDCLLGPERQRQKYLASERAMLSGKFLRVRKVFEIRPYFWPTASYFRICFS